jgi:hypothetical protein
MIQLILVAFPQVQSRKASVLFSLFFFFFRGTFTTFTTVVHCRNSEQSPPINIINYLFFINPLLSFVNLRIRIIFPF